MPCHSLSTNHLVMLVTFKLVTLNIMASKMTRLGDLMTQAGKVLTQTKK